MSDMRKIRIGIVDDQTLFRKSLAALLSKQQNFEVIFETDKKVALHSTLRNQQPDILIMELKLATQSGVEIAEEIRQKYPDIKIIILTLFFNGIFVNPMVRIGINAFLSKNIHPEELFVAIHEVFLNRVYLNESYKDIILHGNGRENMALESEFRAMKKLTERELEILDLICHEYTNMEIASKLFLSIRTVEGHRNNLLSKTGVKNTVGLVLYAILNELVQIDIKLLQASTVNPYFNGHVVSYQ